MSSLNFYFILFWKGCEELKEHIFFNNFNLIGKQLNIFITWVQNFPHAKLEWARWKSHLSYNLCLLSMNCSRSHHNSIVLLECLSFSCSHVNMHKGLWNQISIFSKLKVACDRYCLTAGLFNSVSGHIDMTLTAPRALDQARTKQLKWNDCLNHMSTLMHSGLVCFINLMAV